MMHTENSSANLPNASVRVVHCEEMALAYAPQDGMLAVVLYLNQPTTQPGTVGDNSEIGCSGSSRN